MHFRSFKPFTSPARQLLVRSLGHRYLAYGIRFRVMEDESGLYEGCGDAARKAAGNEHKVRQAVPHAAVPRLPIHTHPPFST